VQLGTPREVYTRPATKTVADFMGLVNLLPGRVLRAAGDDSLVEIGGSHAVALAVPPSAREGQAVEVAVRPESLRLLSDASDGGAPDVVLARVAEVTFLGNLIDCHVTLDDGTRLRIQVDPGRTLETGARVGVRLEREAATVFVA
jgi:iron(III) transport system ATP-binding protein